MLLIKEMLLNGKRLIINGVNRHEWNARSGRCITEADEKWDNMSGSEQLRVATAIVRCLKPQCGFVLLDKLEQMDMTTLTEFGRWLEAEHLQAIATRVSTGSECQIIIEDGMVKDAEPPVTEKPQPRSWTKGAF